VADLLTELREGTRDAHERLERRLDLLNAPSRSRLRAVLAGFYGFHRVWEPSAERQLGEVMTGRSRLSQLEADLTVLGETQSENISLCTAADIRTHEEAWGSLYVMEGSTLGGQLIRKGPNGLAGMPPEGLAYFNGYGRRTAARWRELQGLLLSLPSHLSSEGIVAGARKTFAVLHDWLPPAERPGSG